MSTHRIVRQVLELELASPDRAAVLQEAAAQLLRGRGLAEMEALLDRVGEPDRVLRLERLELDLGVVQGPDWEAQLLERLAGRLEDALEEATRPPPPGTAQAEAGVQDAGEARFQQFLFFLSHGRLPWWGERPKGTWAQALPPALDPGQWRALGELLRTEPRARRRLAYSADDAFLAAAVETLAGLTDAPRVLELIAPEGLPRSLWPGWRGTFWTLLLDCAVQGTPDGVHARRLARQLLAHRASATGQHWRKTDLAGRREPTALQGIAGARLAALPQPWRDWLEAVVEGSMPVGEAAAEPSAGSNAGTGAGWRKDATGDDEAVAPGAEALPRHPSLGGSGARGHPKAGEQRFARGSRTEGVPAGHPFETQAGQRHAALAPSPASPKPSGPAMHPQARPARVPGELRTPATGSGEARHQAAEPGACELHEAIYLQGAGAVIFHPFLEELFRDRGLLEGSGFVDSAARAHAVHLVGWLTYGTQEVPEYDLLLAKLLCGLAWEEPVRPEVPSRQDRQACEALLEAVLRHWSALRSTSREWLREGFLLREGKLEGVDQGWRLTVEGRAQDVLLDRLPWGLGLIRLPWMSRLLYVHRSR